MTTVSHRESRLSPLEYHQPLTTNEMQSERGFLKEDAEVDRRCGHRDGFYIQGERELGGVTKSHAYHRLNSGH